MRRPADSAERTRRGGKMPVQIWESEAVVGWAELGPGADFQ
jgi:hypothetical protein